jgi:hypothetical protein
MKEHLDLDALLIHGVQPAGQVGHLAHEYGDAFIPESAVDEAPCDVPSRAFAPGGLNRLGAERIRTFQKVPGVLAFDYVRIGINHRA